MSAHGLPRHICPYCLRQFETGQGVKAHQKAKRHTVDERQEGGNVERRLRAYDHARRAAIRAERSDQSAQRELSDAAQVEDRGPGRQNQ